MIDALFSAEAEKELTFLFEAVEDRLDEEVDFDGGVLTIDFEDGRQYVINKHFASQQIWLSSPVSGASHYYLDDSSNLWVNTRDTGKADLRQLIFQELAAITGDNFGDT